MPILPPGPFPSSGCRIPGEADPGDARHTLQRQPEPAYTTRVHYLSPYVGLYLGDADYFEYFFLGPIFQSSRFTKYLPPYSTSSQSHFGRNRCRRSPTVTSPGSSESSHPAHHDDILTPPGDMNPRQGISNTSSSESLNIHSTNAGIRKSNSRSRRRPSPHWSEEAVRGSCTPTIQIPTDHPTLTQESFNAFLQDQNARSAPVMGPLPQTPEQNVGVDEWLGVLPGEDDSAAWSASSGAPWSSYPVSTDISPITAPDYTYSPATSAFTGMPALMPHASSFPHLPFLPTEPDLSSFQPGSSGSEFMFDNSLSLANPPFQDDLLAPAPFVPRRASMGEGQRPMYVAEYFGSGRPYLVDTDFTPNRKHLSYKPLSTWFHLWLI